MRAQTRTYAALMVAVLIGHGVVASAAQQPPATPPPRPAPAHVEPAQWYMSIDGQQVGPVSEDEIRTKLVNGGIDANTLLFTAGMTNWTPLGAVPQFTPLLKPGLPGTAAPQPPAGTDGKAATPVAAAVVPGDYVIGPDDIITVAFWRDKDMSVDAVVRPDGRITLPLLNDVNAAGLTPEQLRVAVKAQAAKYIEDPNVTVTIKQINSRRVYVTGQVGRPGPYALSVPTTVLQLLSIAGGVNEFANTKRILIMRTENGTQKALPFNYKDVIRGKNLQQNVLLKPGDTVVVP